MKKGTLDEGPSNVTGLTTYLLVGVIVAVLCYSIFLIAFLLDDRIRTEEDIQKYLGLSILGDIPNMKQADKKSYGYGSYGYGSHHYGRKQTDTKGESD